jgi:hypothetical protein
MLSILHSYLEKEENSELAESMLENYNRKYFISALHTQQDNKADMPLVYFELLNRQAMGEKLKNSLSRLAYLISKVERGWQEKEKAVIYRLIRDFCRQEIVFPYFEEFADFVIVPSLWRESVFFWFESEEEKEYTLAVISDFGEDCRKSVFKTREILPGFYYGSIYIPVFERMKQITVTDYEGPVSVMRMKKTVPGSRNELLSEMKEAKGPVGSRMTDYEKILERMKEQLKFLSDR